MKVPLEPRERTRRSSPPLLYVVVYEILDAQDEVRVNLKLKFDTGLYCPSDRDIAPAHQPVD